MNLPQELIGMIASFLPTKDSFSLVGVNRHWMDSVLHTQHEIDILHVKHPHKFCSTMEYVNFLTKVKLEHCKTLEIVHLAFLDKMKETLKTLVIRKHSLGAVILKDFPVLEQLEISNSAELHTVSLKNVPKLINMDLSKTGIINASNILNFLKEDSVLETLSFHGCQNLYHHLEFPCPVDSLRTLDISRTMIHREILEKVVKDCPNLISLRLDRCTNLKNLVIRDHFYLSDLSMYFCKGLYGIRILGNSSLTRLNLSSNAVFGKFLCDILRSNPSLKTVDFSNCYNFNELSEGFEEISLPDLEFLNCDFTPLRDEHVKVLMKVCSGLKTLNLKQTEILNLLDCGSSTLESIGISGTNLTNLGLTEVLQNCISLKSLNISTCQALRDGQVQFPESLNLEVLWMKNTVLTQITISELISKYPNLKELIISRINIDDNNRVIEILDAKCLEKLDVSGNNRIKKLVIKRCPNLIDLNLTECFGMKDWEFSDDIFFISSSSSCCSTITVTDCREEFIRFVEEKYPHVRIIGSKRSYEKGYSYQQLNFLRCLKRNKQKQFGPQQQQQQQQLNEEEKKE